MAGRRNRQMDIDKVNRYLEQGRGKGEGNDYKPWLEVYEVPSIGRVHRTPSLTNDRIYHLMSDGEEAFFLMCDWSDHIIDIREQYPLDPDETSRIAKELGIRHPKNEDGTPYVMTCDFFLTVIEDGKKKLYARTYKPYSEIGKKRVREKFEIEKVYWARKEIDWSIVTEHEIDIVLIKNIEEILGFKTLMGIEEAYPGAFQQAAELLVDNLHRDKSMRLRDLCRKIDEHLKVNIDTAEPAAKYLLANKYLCTDMHREAYLITRKVGELWFSEVGVQSNVIE